MEAEGCEQSARFGHCSCEDVVKVARARQVACPPTTKIWGLRVRVQLAAFLLLIVSIKHRREGIRYILTL
jgi:hypothetical protein